VPVDRVVRVGVGQNRPGHRDGRIQHSAECVGAQTLRPEGQERLQRASRSGVLGVGFRHDLSGCKIGTALLA